jgi:aromatic-L-amino-acid decarboxylase
MSPLPPAGPEAAVPPHMTPEEFRALGHRVVDWIAGYMGRVGDLPVLSPAKPGEVLGKLPAHAPTVGFGGEPSALHVSTPDMSVAVRGTPPSPWDPVFADLERIILPGLTHWQSPNFFAFFPCNASGPAILGEMLSAGLNVNGMLWASSPAATELEIRVLDWLGEMIGLPAAFLSSSENGGGVIQGTASESTLIAMIAARKRAVDAGAAPDRLVAYTSTQAHSSVVKAAMIMGLISGPEDRSHLRLIDVDQTYAMRADLLEQAMGRDLAAGLTPFYVCATVGTTSSTAVDPVAAIAAVIERIGKEKDHAPESGTGHRPVPPGSVGARTWLHVDAAHAGAACVCSEFRHLIDGVERADSLCFNPHKWLLTNFDCDCFWTRDRRSLISALSVTPEYLRNAASDAGSVIDYRDWQVPLGRRFRALKLWLVIRHYGVEGLRAHIREHVRLAALLEGWVRADTRFEVAAPRTVNLVCFRLRGEGSDARNKALLDALNASGHLYLTHTVLPANGAGPARLVLRMCIGAPGTGEDHVRRAWRLIQATTGMVA